MHGSEPRRRFLALAGGAITSAAAGCTALLGGDSDGPQKIDDWEFDPSQLEDRDASAAGGSTTGSGGGGGQSYSANAPQSGGSGDLGLAVGGANNVATFRRNVEEGFLPQPESVAYEGLFYDYFFDTGDSSCNQLFCPVSSPAVSPDPLSDAREEYLTVGLDSSLTEDSFERKPLNLVIVLDISGSMDHEFDSYYYDRTGQRREVEGETDRRKIAVARDALETLTKQLRPGDRLGVVLYNGEAYRAKPLRRVAATDMDAIREHIQEDIRATGGTNAEAGIDMATGLLEPHADADPTERENRTILITDAMPNIGDTSVGGLRGTLENNADRNLYTTVVGVGVDFNTELVSRITEIEGANYSGVHSADEFEERMGERFEYMVSPVVFDLSLELDSEDYRIHRVYGSASGTETQDQLVHVNTLFPSPTQDGGTRGGVILVELEPTGDGGTGDGSGGEGAAGGLALSASWRDRSGSSQSTMQLVPMPDAAETYDSTGVRKAILLQRYATLVRNWIAHERGTPSVPEAKGIEAPHEPRELGQWEQQSVPLTVSPEYAERFRSFREHFAAETAAIGDSELERELDVIDEILSYA